MEAPIVIPAKAGIQSFQLLGASADLSRVHLDTVQTATQMVADHLGLENGAVLSQLATFVSWDLKNNHPKMIIDFKETSVESVWMA